LPVKSVGLSKDSMVNLAQLLTIDKLRLMKRIGNLPAELIGQVNEASKISLAI